MELKLLANTEPRKRFHMVRRLRKATQYAEELCKLSESDQCDPRTKLEAQVGVIVGLHYHRSDVLILNP